MLIVGWGDKSSVLGQGFVQDCQNCNNSSRWPIVEMAHRIRLYFVPVAKWGRKYYYLCPVCKHGFELPSRELAQLILAAALENPTTPTEEVAEEITTLWRQQAIAKQKGRIRRHDTVN